MLQSWHYLSSHGTAHHNSAVMMNKSMLQFQMILMAMLLMLTCFSQNAGGTLTCSYYIMDYGKRTFNVEPYEDEAVAPRAALNVNTNITCFHSGPSTGREWFFEIECPVGWQILIRLPVRVIDSRIEFIVYDHDHDGDYEILDLLEPGPSINPLSIFSSSNLLGIEIYAEDTADMTWDFSLGAGIAKVIERINNADLPESGCTWNILENMENGRGLNAMELSCLPRDSSYENVLVSFNYDIQGGVSLDGYFTIVCWEFDGQQPNNIVRYRGIRRLRITCNRTSGALSVRFTPLHDMINIARHVNGIAIETVVWGRDSLLSSNAGREVINIAVSCIIVIFILVAGLILLIWCKRRIKPVANSSNEVEGKNSGVNARRDDETSEGAVTTNANPRYVFSNTVDEEAHGVCNPSNHDRRVTYNEIGEQDYNVLFGGMERGDYHEYNVPDNPQDRPTNERTTPHGSGPYQDLMKNRLDVSVDAERSKGTTGIKQKLPDEHAYQDLRQDEMNLNGVHPDDEYAHQQAKTEIPSVTENEYQALEKDTPEYATLESSNDYTALGQGDSNQSMKGGTDCSRILVEKPLEDGRHEELGAKLGKTSEYEDPIKDLPGEPYDHIQRAKLPDTSAASRPTISGPQSYNDDDDYQTPVNVADEDPRNTYKTLEKPELQDADAEEYSRLRRSPRTNHLPNSTDNNTQYGKLNLADTA